MNIGILGARNVGGALGKKWVAAGHTVMFGVRFVTNPEAQALARSLGEGASVGTVDQTIAFGEVVVFAIPGEAMDQTISAHAPALGNKIIIDSANKVGSATMNSVASFSARVPSAQIYRAFNNLGWENFEHPQFGDLQADLFYCGPDGPARVIMKGLIADVGLRPIYVGGLDQVELVDTVTRLWFALAIEQDMGRHLAFKVLTR